MMALTAKDGSIVVDESDIDFQLLRMIIIDSYCPGKKVEMRLDGHVSINGSNGAGKTTLLRLIPIFFGERPQRVIFGSDNFAERYLPTTTSYIIFEYKRRDSVVMAVIHANGQKDSASYRFIDHAYDDNIFISNNAFVQSQDLHKHLQMLSVLETNILSRNDYRQILVNDATSSSENKQFTARFSFSGRGRLKNINRVVTGVLNRITKFEDLRQMVISSIMDDDKKFKLNTKKNELVKWLKELQAHESLGEKRALMEAIEVAETKRVSLTYEISVLHARLQAYINHFSEEDNKLAVELVTKKKSRDDSDQEMISKISVAQLAKVNLDAQLSGLESEIKNLQNKFKLYHENKIEESCVLLDAIDANKVKAEVIAQQIKDMSGEIKDVDNQFNNLKLQKSQAASQEKIELLNLKSEITARSQQDKNDAVSNRDTLGQKVRAILEESIALQRTKEIDANKAVASLRERLKNVTGDSVIQESIDDAQSNLDNVNNTLGEIYRARSEAESELNVAKSKFNDQETLFNDSTAIMEDAEGGYEKLLSFAKAGGDTLIGFLRTERPEWVANIGRVIHEDLLLRSDLEPDFTEGSTLYGLNINLDKINASNLSSEEALKQDLQAAEHRVKKLKATVEDDHKKLSELSVLFKEAKERLSLLDVNLSSKQGEKTQDIAKLNSLRIQLDRSKASKRSNIENELAKGVADLHALQDAIQIENKKFANSINQQKSLYDERVIELQMAENAALSALDKRAESIAEALKIELANLEKARLKQLEEKGVPQELLLNFEKQLSTINQAIDLAQSKAKEVREYRDWLEFSYSQLNEKVLASNSMKIDVEIAATKLLAVQAEKNEAYRKHSEIISELENNKHQVEDDIRNANTHLSTLALWPKDPMVLAMPHDIAYTLMELIRQKINSLDEYEKQVATIAKGVGEIRQEMLRMVNTAPEQYCLLAETEFGSPRLHHEYAWMEVARGWFNQQDKESEKKISLDGRQQGLSIKIFCDELENLKHTVSNFNRELRSSLNQATMFTKIQNVDVHISTDVDKQDYWQGIDRLRFEYDTWHPMSGNSLPPASFVQAAQDIASILADERGIVATPSDLIQIRIEATIDGRTVSARDEKELQNLSSNGLSYLVLAIVMVGFVNKIRGENKVAIPYAIDEVGNLDLNNSTLLLEFLAHNNIRLIGAFPDVNERLAPLFKYKYNVLDDRRIGLIDLGRKAEHSHV